MNDCLFCKIIAGDIPAQRLYEDEQVLVIPDKYPKADVHLLVLTKLHIPSLIDISHAHNSLITHIIHLLPRVATENGLTNGFRVIINNGPGGGQEIPHIHFHVLGTPPKIS